MGNFRPNDRGGFRGRSGGSYGSRPGFGGRGKFGGDRDSGRFNRRSSEMHDVTCSKCGKKCQVPFKPTGDKPVYCDDCFKHNNPRNLDGGSRPEVSSEQFNQINAKLDRILRAIESLEIDVGDEPDEDFDEEDEDSEDEEDDEDSEDEKDEGDFDDK